MPITENLSVKEKHLHFEDVSLSRSVLFSFLFTFDATYIKLAAHTTYSIEIESYRKIFIIFLYI